MSVVMLPFGEVIIFEIKLNIYIFNFFIIVKFPPNVLNIFL
jgi:hypothetical protein